ncbi:unnamed protein product [Prunus armeniaca]
MISQFPSDHQDQSDFKRLKESPRSSSSINDLPDLVLVEILCRLPLKSTFQCKCISKVDNAKIPPDDDGANTNFISLNKHSFVAAQLGAINVTTTSAIPTPSSGSLFFPPLNVTRRYERDSYAFLRNKMIFCSESGKGTEAVASSPRSFCVNRLLCDAVVHNGMLYWWGIDFIIGFNPYSSDTGSTTTDVDRHIYCCRFIDKPVEEFAGSFATPNVCRGCLRISQRFCYTNPVGKTVLGFSIWEFKDDGDQVNGGRWCLLDRFYIRQIIAKDLLISKWYHGRY